MSLDRFFIVKIVRWKNYFKSKHAFWASIGCILVLMLINSNVFVLYGAQVEVNGTVMVKCVSDTSPETSWMSTWSLAHACLYSYAPALLLSVTNIQLILNFKQRSNSSIQNDHIRKQTVRLIEQ